MKLVQYKATGTGTVETNCTYEQCYRGMESVDGNGSGYLGIEFLGKAYIGMMYIHILEWSGHCTNEFIQE
jgi:hypothetical protein